MICTRSHLVCCEGCMFFLLVLAPGTFRRESSTSLLGTQPLCPRRPSSAKERRHSLGAMSRNEQRPPASLRPPHGERNQPHLWLLGNSSAWGQLASPLTGGSGRVICEGKSEKGVLGGLTIFWSVCVCVCAHALAWTRAHMFGGRVSGCLKHSSQQPLLSPQTNKTLLADPVLLPRLLASCTPPCTPTPCRPLAVRPEEAREAVWWDSECHVVTVVEDGCILEDSVGSMEDAPSG